MKARTSDKKFKTAELHVAEGCKTKLYVKSFHYIGVSTSL